MSGASDERADKARRSGRTVPVGAGGGLRMTVLASLERITSLTSVGRLVLLAQSHARDRALFTDRLAGKGRDGGRPGGAPGTTLCLKARSMTRARGEQSRLRGQ